MKKIWITIKNSYYNDSIPFGIITSTVYLINPQSVFGVNMTPINFYSKNFT